MVTTQRAKAAAAAAGAQAIIPASSDTNIARPSSPEGFYQDFGPRSVGYGLPCAKCKTYYASDLATCPVCRSSERVSPKAVPVRPIPAVEGGTTAGELEEEREKFLRELKAQLFASHTQIKTASTFRCGNEENHQGSSEPASVCEACYEKARQRADVMEGALHMDLQEATQIVYDAVWADSSDPSRSYQNAAQALLNEIRKRAGINQIMGTHQALVH